MTRDATPPSAVAELLRESSVRYTSVRELVYSTLKKAILSGVVPPGGLLRQEELADSLGVSRNPVRAALLQLEADGLVQLRTHRMATVTMLTEKQIRDIYATRALLETQAIKEVVRLLDADRLERLEQLAREADSEQAGEHFVDAVFLFWDEFYADLENRVLADLIRRLRQSVGRHWLSQRLRHHHAHSHAMLLSHVRRRDAEAAAAWVADHLRWVVEEHLAQTQAELVGPGPAQLSSR
ncbi:MAG TPA: GntR family transcriptional regulator [Candidatus Dormibacteraeota bacterium]|nr:GntR family transcriptional regulator [Candidatus Dormibacteraeota bacterium]